MASAPRSFLHHILCRDVARILGHIHHRPVSYGLDGSRHWLAHRLDNESDAARLVVLRTPFTRHHWWCRSSDCLPSTNPHSLFLHLHFGRLGLSGSRSPPLRPHFATCRTAWKIVLPHAHWLRLQRPCRDGHAHDRKPQESPPHHDHPTLHVVLSATHGLHGVHPRILSSPCHMDHVRTLYLWHPCRLRISMADEPFHPPS